MRLLFDQNLSIKLVDRLTDVFSESVHVRSVGLDRADDEKVWRYAREQGFSLISKDADFHQRSLLYGFPPKVIWIRLGNSSTAEIEAVLRGRREAILCFGADSESSFLVIEGTVI